MASPFLQLTDATVILGGACVLDALTMTIPLGQHTAIVGPNGAGKSTFVKLLTLQLYPIAPAGTAAPEPRTVDCPIRVFGEDRWEVFALRTRLGIVSADLHDRFVHGNSNGMLTGADAVISGFFATDGVFAHQRVTDRMRRRAREALARVGAAHLARRTLDTVSTGEARRILIARALVHNPEVLVLDEPTRGLDLVARHQFMTHVAGLAREGTTILLVTHYLDEVIPEIDRVVLLKRGRIVADGAKRDVLTAASLSTAFETPLRVEQVDGYFHVRVDRSGARSLLDA